MQQHAQQKWQEARAEARQAFALLSQEVLNRQSQVLREIEESMMREVKLLNDRRVRCLLRKINLCKAHLSKLQQGLVTESQSPAGVSLGLSMAIEEMGRLAAVCNQWLPLFQARVVRSSAVVSGAVFC